MFKKELNRPLYSGRIFERLLTAVLAASTTRCHAAVTSNGSTQNVTTAITNPDVPRNVTATAGGTAGDIKAIQVTVTGTNERGETISETLPAFTVDTAGTVTGSKIFKTVTAISIPTHDGNGATTAIGYGSKLGIGDTLSVNSVIAAYLGGVKEGTAPTVAVNATTLESNSVTLNSALNGSDVKVHYYQS
jgi:hypothetical protein